MTNLQDLPLTFPDIDTFLQAIEPHFPKLSEEIKEANRRARIVLEVIPGGELEVNWTVHAPIAQKDRDWECEWQIL